MSKKVKVKLNYANVGKLLKSQMMMDAVMEAAIGQGEIDTSYVGHDRVQVVVKTEGNDNAD